MNFRTIFNVLLNGLGAYTAAVGAGLDPKTAGIATGIALVTNLIGLSQQQTNVLADFINTFRKK